MIYPNTQFQSLVNCFTEGLCKLQTRFPQLSPIYLDFIKMYLFVPQSAMCSTGVSGEAKRRLQHHIEEVITTLPADLQSVLKPS